MAVIAESRSGSAGLPAHAGVRIAVENFGPIGKGEVELRPLTIFVGASNTGKTCFSVLIYALHKTLEGFSRIPVCGRQIDRMIDRAAKFFLGSFGVSEEERPTISRTVKELLITYQAHPGSVGLPRSQSSWDRGHPCPRTGLVAPLIPACRGLEARAPRSEVPDPGQLWDQDEPGT